MLRRAASLVGGVARPALAGPGCRPWATASSSASSSSRARRLESSVRPSWALGAVLAGGTGYCLAHTGVLSRTAGPESTCGGGGELRPARHPEQAPAVPADAAEGDIPVESPVRPLDLAAVDAKLREQACSFVFASDAAGSRGRVDVVRVASNSPVEDEWAVAYGRGIAGADALYVGVYDGHAGWATSAVLRDALIRYVSASLGRLGPRCGDAAVEAAIQGAFVRLDERIMADAKRALSADHEHGAPAAVGALAPAIAGSCALLSIYDAASRTLRTAVTGDSRAVLGSATAPAACPLSVDQTGFNADERARLDGEHPGEMDDMIDLAAGRLLGMAVTRAFGDHRWKWTGEDVAAAQARFFGYGPRPKAKTPPYMTARPEVTTRTVAADDFVILASDGLWDVMSNDDAVACVRRWLAAKRAGRAEDVRPAVSRISMADGGYATWKATPDAFAIEDLDNAAVCLVKNALGGCRRQMLRGAATVSAPLSRHVRDDMTVQVVFFTDPYETAS